ncbi:MAG: DUF4097 family beta strand repeat-containing protein [Acidobacteriota bacterium]|nr:DUF4097 family beta strand repeat-containing protein [Acidobacteriota bacterium]
MKSNLITAQFFRCALALIIICLPGLIVSAQNKAEYKTKNKDFCQNNNYSNGDKIQFKETREVTIPAGSVVNVDGQRNGGIKVRGENRSDILIRACVQTVGATDEEARAAAKNIRIETGSTIRADGAGEENNWAVSYEILVPRSTNLKLKAHNGGIGINSVEGTIEFETRNGGVSLEDVAGNVKGKTANGGLKVVLSGNTWRGSGLDVETTNGGVHLTLPETYAARIETGTVNGGFKSEISGLNVERNDRTRAVRLNTDLNGGGAPIRVITTNGGVKISSSTVKNL